MHDRHAGGMKILLCLIALLSTPALQAQDAPNWLAEPFPVPAIRLAEPGPDELVVVINDNALGGNHAGLFAGTLLLDPAGSYLGMRRRNADWTGPSLADYARYQTTDGPAVRFYRFRLRPAAFETIRRRIREADPTPPLFCASAVQNLLVGIAPFDALAETGFTTPSALGRRLDALTQGAGAVGECQKLDASPC